MDKGKQKKKRSDGFTLIELMVSVSIFAIVTLITSGSFIVLANIYRKVQSNRAIIDNLNLAMDTMTLQIREGDSYDVSRTPREFTFTERYIDENNDYVEGRTITYKKENDVNGRGTLLQCENNSDCIELTSEEIDVKNINFISSDEDPLRITVVMEGEALNKQGLQSHFLLQTTLSQRNYSRS